MLTKEQANIITGFTGMTASNFSDFHKDVEKRMGRPVWTHEFPALRETIQELYRADFIAMCPH